MRPQSRHLTAGPLGRGEEAGEESFDAEVVVLLLSGGVVLGSSSEIEAQEESAVAKVVVVGPQFFVGPDSSR